MPTTDKQSLVVWTVCDGEPMPTDEGKPRLLRMAILSKLLADKGHHVTYWSSRYNHLRKTERDIPIGYSDSGEGYKIHYVDGIPYKSNVSIRRLFHNLLVAHKTKKAMHSAIERPDIIVVDLPTLELAKMVSQLQMEWNVPVVLSVRDLWPDVFYTLFPNYLIGLAKVLLLWMEHQAATACRRATSIVGISDGYLNWGLKKAGRIKRSQDHIIPLGYPELKKQPESTVGASREKLKNAGVRFDRKIIGFVGTFGQSYDLETVIKAAKSLENRRDTQFVLCGEGEYGRDWRRQAEGLTNVIFPGWLDRSEISVLLESSFVGLAAYGREAKQGLPNKFFEYMSYGLPVVSSLIGEAASEINEYKIGSNYKPQDWEDLSKKLIEILDNSDLHAQMQDAAKKRFDSEYRQSAVYPRYCDLVEQIAIANLRTANT